MKIKAMLLVALGLLTQTVSAQEQEVSGKRACTVYMFGMAASFNDSLVCFTQVQQVDSAWISKKSKFLLGRDQYSYQLKEYLADSMSLDRRTCITYFGTKRPKVEKQLKKMLTLYTVGKKKKSKKVQPPMYKVISVDSLDFHYRAIDMGDYDDENDPKMIAQRKAEAKRLKAESKAKKKADKAANKAAKAERKAKNKANKEARKAAEKAQQESKK